MPPGRDSFRRNRVAPLRSYFSISKVQTEMRCALIRGFGFALDFYRSGAKLSDILVIAVPQVSILFRGLRGQACCRLIRGAAVPTSAALHYAEPYAHHVGNSCRFGSDPRANDPNAAG